MAMGEKRLSDSERDAIARNERLEFDGVAGSDRPAYVTEAGSHVIASLLLGNDPITIESHYGNTLRVKITGTPWE